MIIMSGHECLPDREKMHQIMQLRSSQRRKIPGFAGFVTPDQIFAVHKQLAVFVVQTKVSARRRPFIVYLAGHIFSDGSLQGNTARMGLVRSLHTLQEITYFFS